MSRRHLEVVAFCLGPQADKYTREGLEHELRHRYGIGPEHYVTKKLGEAEPRLASPIEQRPPHTQLGFACQASRYFVLGLSHHPRTKAFSRALFDLGINKKLITCNLQSFPNIASVRYLNLPAHNTLPNCDFIDLGTLEGLTAYVKHHDYPASGRVPAKTELTFYLMRDGQTIAQSDFTVTATADLVKPTVKTSAQALQAIADDMQMNIFHRIPEQLRQPAEVTTNWQILHHQADYDAEKLPRRLFVLGPSNHAKTFHPLVDYLQTKGIKQKALLEQIPGEALNGHLDIAGKLGGLEASATTFTCLDLSDYPDLVVFTQPKDTLRHRVVITDLTQVLFYQNEVIARSDFRAQTDAQSPLQYNLDFQALNADIDMEFVQIPRGLGLYVDRNHHHKGHRVTVYQLCDARGIVAETKLKTSKLTTEPNEKFFASIPRIIPKSSQQKRCLQFYLGEPDKHATYALLVEQLKTLGMPPDRFKTIGDGDELLDVVDLTDCPDFYAEQRPGGNFTSLYHRGHFLAIFENSDSISQLIHHTPKTNPTNSKFGKCSSFMLGPVEQQDTPQFRALVNLLRAAGIEISSVQRQARSAEYSAQLPNDSLFLSTAGSEDLRVQRTLTTSKDGMHTHVVYQLIKVNDIIARTELLSNPTGEGYTYLAAPQLDKLLPLIPPGGPHFCLGPIAKQHQFQVLLDLLKLDERIKLSQTYKLAGYYFIDIPKDHPSLRWQFNPQTLAYRLEYLGERLAEISLQYRGAKLPDYRFNVYTTKLQYQVFFKQLALLQQEENTIRQNGYADDADELYQLHEQLNTLLLNYVYPNPSQETERLSETAFKQRVIQCIDDAESILERHPSAAIIAANILLIVGTLGVGLLACTASYLFRGKFLFFNHNVCMLRAKEETVKAFEEIEAETAARLA